MLQEKKNLVVQWLQYRRDRNDAYFERLKSEPKECWDSPEQRRHHLLHCSLYDQWFDWVDVDDLEDRHFEEFYPQALEWQRDQEEQAAYLAREKEKSDRLEKRRLWMAVHLHKDDVQFQEVKTIDWTKPHDVLYYSSFGYLMVQFGESIYARPGWNAKWYQIPMDPAI